MTRSDRQHPKQLPSLQELCLHSLCLHTLSLSPPRPVLSSLQQLPLPPIIIDQATDWYVARVQPQISHWRRKHANFYHALLGHLDNRSKSVEICDQCGNMELIADAVFSGGKLAWTPFLHVDYSASVHKMSQALPDTTCQHLNRLVTPIIDPTTCRDGLEFDTDY